MQLVESITIAGWYGFCCITSESMSLDSSWTRALKGSVIRANERTRTAFPIPSTPVPSHMEALMRKPVFICLLVVLAVLMTSGMLQAQSSAITGRVSDPQGAVVANARITATNTATGIA